MKILTIILVLLCLYLSYVIWQYFELKKFEMTQYQIFSDKIHEEQLFAVLADLHGFEYGKENEKLVEKIKSCNPRGILIAGDMIVSKKTDTYQKAKNLLQQLAEIAPVYYSFGNHESRAAQKGLIVSGDFSAYIQEISALGIHILRNEKLLLEEGRERISVAGVEIPLCFYEKGQNVPMEKDSIQRFVGHAESEAFQILLAHNPMYSEQYAAWGADLTLCGHNHGGLVRIPGIGSLMSPQLTFFPKYNDGMYEIRDKKIIVSRGLGTHTFHVRIFNRAELLLVRLLPDTLEK